MFPVFGSSVSSSASSEVTASHIQRPRRTVFLFSRFLGSSVSLPSEYCQSATVSDSRVRISNGATAPFVKEEARPWPRNLPRYMYRGNITSVPPRGNPLKRGIFSTPLRGLSARPIEILHSPRYHRNLRDNTGRGAYRFHRLSLDAKHLMKYRRTQGWPQME